MKVKRKYYRHCGVCGKRYEQSDMIRTYLSENGWMCERCYESIDRDPYLDLDDSDMGYEW